MTLNELEVLITVWADERNIIAGSNVQSQYVKLIEEIGELASGISKGKQDVIKDSIGDAFVVLTIIAAQCGYSVEECADLAYNEIKHRKGRMVDGVFVKESDL